MEVKETLFKTEMQRTLLNDDDYFKYIFKKTEKIVCAVLYVLRSNPDIRHDDTLVSTLETTSDKLMDSVHTTLKATSGARVLRLEDLKVALIAFESRLNMAAAGGVLAYELLEVFHQELFTLSRSLKRYSTPDGRPVFFDEIAPVSYESRKTRERVTRERSPQLASGSGASVQTEDRRQRVLEVIRDKREATIKDISERVTDCSEKTIQRELIDLIKDGIIVREGERRWSKYKLV